MQKLRHNALVGHEGAQVRGFAALPAGEETHHTKHLTVSKHYRHYTIFPQA